MTDEERAWREAEKALLVRARCAKFHHASLLPESRRRVPLDLDAALVSLSAAYDHRDATYVAYIDSLVSTARTARAEQQVGASQ